MRKLVILTVAALALSTPALANPCPQEMVTLDGHLRQHGSMLDTEQTAQVRQLRAEAEADHEAGQHEDALQAIGQAYKVMGM